ncbi:DUF5959 family protein [Embleya sp. MST-111070]|uniref:DUF5959 family protein n=1 Tax=Embleya sp. MST-111070 TaxID=3398231 RepID=UPI003F73ADA3
MDANTGQDAIVVIRLADLGQSVAVRLRPSEHTPSGPGVRFLEADVVVTSDFMGGAVHLGFDTADLADREVILDTLKEAEHADSYEPFAADWPRSGRTAYLRLIADDPYVVEIHDGPDTGIVVSVPLDMGPGWITESRRRLTATRAALGIGIGIDTART